MLSVLLAVAAVTVWRQVNFIRHKDLGFRRDHLIVLPVFLSHRESRADRSEYLAARYPAVKRAFLEHPGVEKATAYTFPEGMGLSRLRLVRSEGEGHDEVYMPLQQADEDYLDTFGMKLVEGRNFSVATRSDFTDAVIVNEAAVKQFGWEEPLGKRFEVVFLERQGTVIGVVEDYHHESLERPIGPTAIYMRFHFCSYLSLRVRSENFSETVDHLEETWNRFVPNRLFRFWFVDEQIDSLYREDRRLAQLFTVFASLAIFVACLGLFGLTAYTVEQRTKEIGVRFSFC